VGIPPSKDLFMNMRRTLAVSMVSAASGAAVMIWCGAALVAAPAAGRAADGPPQSAARAPQSPPPAAASAPVTRADLTPVEADDRLFKAYPEVQLNPDGTGVVTFETMVPSPAARVFVGTLNPDTPIDTPIFTATVREDLQGAAGGAVTAHRLPFGVRGLDGWLAPAPAGTVREGDACIRLEAFDPRTSAMRYLETRLHYATAAGKYERRTTVLLGPTIDRVTATGAAIGLDTDRPAFARVEVWSADGTRRVAEAAGSSTASRTHAVALSGLKPGTPYRYRVLVSELASGPAANTGRFYTFRTAPAPGPASVFSFAFLSDGRAGTGGGFFNFNGINGAVTPRLIAEAYRRGDAFALFGGDLTSGYTSSVEHFGMMLDTWRSLNDPIAHVMPIYEGFGNHESLHAFYREPSGARLSTDRLGSATSEGEFGRRFINPDNGPEPEVLNGVTGPSYKGTVYSFDYGNTHIVMLNTDYWFTVGGTASDRSLGVKLLGGNRNGYILPNQMAWLDRDLAEARARGAVHLFVAAHDPLLPVSGHVADAMWWRGLNDPSVPSGDVVAMRDRFAAILDRHRVTALLTGHEHLYARVVADATVIPTLTRPLVQFVSGGAGAPFYTLDEAAPWAAAVKMHATTYHYVRIIVNGPKASFEAIDLDGRVIDKGTLR
jgi:3',5'-cyclic AMP phosphodiesterase CpdA